MEDFSLYFFMKYFDEVVITDVDIETCKSVVNDMDLSKIEKSKLSYRDVEYTGFSKTGFFDDFKERTVNARDFKKLDMIIDQKLSEIDNYYFLDEYIGSFDFIYVSPIYTQLIYNQVLMECSMLREKGYPEHLLKYIENKMLDEMINIINRFNDNLDKLLKINGTMFVLSDILQLNNGSNFELRVRSSIKSVEIMNDIYNSYKDMYGMGLGDYGLYNLDDKFESAAGRWLIWPFTKETSFVVKLKIYTKKEYFEEVQK